MTSSLLWQRRIRVMVRVFKNDVRLWEPFHCCSALLLQMQLGRHKHGSRRHKHSSGRRKRSSERSLNEAALHFGNLCVYEPSALWKKPSTSLEKPYNSWKKPTNLCKKPSSFQCKLHRKCILEKRSECQRHFFDTYRRVTRVSYRTLGKGGFPPP